MWRKRNFLLEDHLLNQILFPLRNLCELCVQPSGQRTPKLGIKGIVWSHFNVPSNRLLSFQNCDSATLSETFRAPFATVYLKMELHHQIDHIGDIGRYKNAPFHAVQSSPFSAEDEGKEQDPDEDVQEDVKKSALTDLQRPDDGGNAQDKKDVED